MFAGALAKWCIQWSRHNLERVLPLPWHSKPGTLIFVLSTAILFVWIFSLR